MSNGLGPYPDLVPSCERVKNEVTINVFPDPEYDPYLTGKSTSAPLTGSIHPMASSKATFINSGIDAFRSGSYFFLTKYKLVETKKLIIKIFYFLKISSHRNSF